jgi:hypothetical protein
LIPLLEESSSQFAHDATAVLRQLTSSPDPWFRALSLHAIGEMLSRDLQTLAARANEDTDPIVREAANAAIRIGGEMSETLKTLGTMDRILFLRQVPVFATWSRGFETDREIASERIFLEGDFLSRGEIGDELFVIVEGSVRGKGIEWRCADASQAERRRANYELAILREQLLGECDCRKWDCSCLGDSRRCAALDSQRSPRGRSRNARQSCTAIEYKLISVYDSRCGGKIHAR